MCQGVLATSTPCISYFLKKHRVEYYDRMTEVRGRKIDVFYEDMGVLVEMKGRGVSLDEASVRSRKAGPETPFQQAKWYADNLRCCPAA